MKETSFVVLLSLGLMVEAGALDASGAARADELARSELILDLQGFTGVVTGLAFSPNGRMLAAAGDKEVRIWDVESGELVTTLRGQRQRNACGNCYTVAFSPDGRELLVGVDDYGDQGSIRVYDTNNLGEIKGLAAGHQVPVRKLAFSHDGAFLASAGENGRILLWDWPARRVIGSVPPASASQPLYHAFNFPTAAPLLLVHEAGGSSVISATEARRLRPGSAVPEVLRRWLVSVPQVRFPYQTEPALASLRLDRETWLASGTARKDGRHRYWVGVWRNDLPSPHTLYEGHRYVVTAAALNREGTLAGTADVLGDVHVWNTQTGQRKHVFASLGRPIYRASLDVAAGKLGFGTTPLPSGRWKRNGFGRIERTLDLSTRSLSPRTDGVFPGESDSRHGQTLATVLVDGVYFLQCGAGPEFRYRIRAGAAPMCYSFLRSPRLGIDLPVIQGDDNGVLFCYNPKTDDERRDFIGHRSFVTSLSESDDGRFLTTSSTDRTIRLWSLENYRPTGDVDFEYLSDVVIEVKPNTSAARAGVKVGDRFVSMDGKDLTQLANERLAGTYDYRPGQRVPVLFERGELLRTELVLKEGADLVEPLLSLFLAGDDEWVIWTPQGYYDASPRGDRLIGWHVNRGPAKSAKHYSARQFRKHLYRPDVIDLILETGDVAKAIRLANADRPHATAALDMRQSQVIRELEPPQVRILEPAEGTRTQSPEITLRAEIRSQNELPVGDVTVLVNGRPPGEKQIVRERKSTGLAREISRQIALSPGENEISVLASNSASESGPVSVRVVYEPVVSKVTKPDLYLLAVGISDYAQKEMNLQFAHRDAQEFAAAWTGQKGRVYGNVQTRVITNEEATVREILSGMDWLVKSATRRDVVVMFISAHGLRDERQNYYLASHEINPDNLRSTAVRFSEVKELLRDLPCKVILFVDTCHSGGITGSKAIGWDDPLRDLVAEQYGAVVFSSSSSREISLEDPAWNHGAFTKALLDTFGSTASDNNRDGYLSLTEVEDHVYSRVKELTRGRQHPVVERPSTIRNFNFYSVGS